MRMKQYKKINLNLFDTPDTFEIFPFFIYLNIIRILMIKEPFFLKFLKIYINFISEKTLKFLINKLAQEKILIPHLKNRYKIFINFSMQQIFFQRYNKKNILFPKIKKNFRRSYYLFNQNKTYNFFDYNLKKSKGALNFLNGDFEKNKMHLSIQTIFFLKTANLIEYSWDPKGLKITKIGINLLFDNFKNQFSKILTFFEKNIFLYLIRKFYTWKGCYIVMQKIDCLKNYLKNFKKKKKNIIVEEIWNRIISNHGRKENLFHGFFDDCFAYILFFQEFKVLFFPCLVDKIFYVYPFTYYYQKKETWKENENFYHKHFLDKKYQIIIESNFRIYIYKDAYSGNDLLVTFCKILYELPNLFVGEISEKSILKAFKLGVSSTNIIGFIKNNLHPICSTIPSSVSNQIKSWGYRKMEINMVESILILDSQKKKTKEKNIIFNWKINQKKKFNVGMPILFEKFN